MKRFLAVSIALAMVLVAVPFTAFAAEPDEVWVGDDSMGDLNFSTIQQAIDAVAVWGTVNVAAGEYVEQVVINKDLSLIGEEGAVIKAPDSPETYTIAEDSKKWEPVIFVFGGEEDDNSVSGSQQRIVSISGFTIDGNGHTPKQRSAGILLRNVTGIVDGNTLNNFGLSRETFGIMVEGDSDVVLRENTITGFGRGGIVAGSRGDFPKPNVDIQDNHIETTTPASWAQNGIQIGWGATGKVIGNTVIGHIWDDESWGASGILVPGSSGVEIAQNIVRNNDYGVSLAGYKNYDGYHPCADIIILGNTVYENKYGIGIQGEVSGTNIESNTIHSNEYGIAVYDYSPTDWTGGGVPIDNNVTGNTFYDNDTAVRVWELLEANRPVPEGATLDAGRNWWGSSDEPEQHVSGNLTYSPWALDEDFTTFATRKAVENTDEPVELEEDVNYISIDPSKFGDDDVLTFKQDGMELKLPANLLPEDDVEISITKKDADAVEGFKILGQVYSFVMNDGDNTEFDGTFTLVFTYDDEVDDPENLDIYWFDGDEWLAQGAVVDQDAKTVTLELDHWSDFALMEAEGEEEIPGDEDDEGQEPGDEDEEGQDPGEGEEPGDEDEEEELPKTGTNIMWYLPLGLVFILAGALVLRRKVTA